MIAQPSVPDRSEASPSESDGVHSKGLALLISSAVIFTVALLAVVALGFAGMEISNITRTYATGEAQYSKAQKEAVIVLMRFAQSGAEADYARFKTSLSVLHGDRKARLALEAVPADLDAAREGFLQGRNAPQDISTLIVGFRLFHKWPPFAQAVRDWRIADQQFLRMEQLGEEIRAVVETGATATPAQMAEIAQLDQVSTLSEQRFSDQMGRVAREAIGKAYLAVGVLSLVICVIGVWVVWRLQRVLVQAGAQLAVGKRLAEEANLAKGEFLASMSHEIRTPLTGIIGFTDLLKRVDDLPQRAVTFANRIETAGQALLVVVNDILDYSKIDAGKIELEPRAFDPASFIAETAALISAQVEHKGLGLVIEHEGGLPDAVIADPARLRQILLNLLNNAVKFTAEGEIRIVAGHSGDQLRISVSDTGIGIAADRLHRLFQRFSQADGSVNRRFGGTGLGLAICKNLAELMGGEIDVETKEGVGSTFWFSVEAPGADGVDLLAGVEPLAVEVRPARILVVDDTAINRELIQAMLTPFGHRLVEASGGEDGIEAARHGKFDVILMDLQMPGVDGLAATAAIRSRCEFNRTTPILAISANVLPSQVAACLAAGMDDHIAKPINPAELLVKISAWTARADHRTPVAAE